MWLLVLFGSSVACTDNGYTLFITFEPPSLADEIDRIQISLLDDCSEVEDRPGALPDNVRDQFEVYRIEGLDGVHKLEPAVYSFYALGFRGSSRDCRLAAGCDTHTLTRGGSGILSVRVAGIEPMGCDEMDAGTRDGGVEDSAVDLDAAVCTGTDCRDLLATQVATGALHTCAVLPNHRAACWGDNAYGQIGNGAAAAGSMVATPTLVEGLDTVRQVVAGGFTSCALREDRTVACWGANDAYQAGQTGVLDTPVALTVSGLSNVQSLGPAALHNCAVLESGHVRCWGLNEEGALGNGTFGSQFASPQEVMNLTDVVQVHGGYKFTCARTENGDLYCWGVNNYGQIGDGTHTSRATPVKVEGLTGVVSFAPGGGHVCAIREGGAVYCWGDGAYEQILQGPGVSASTPQPTGITTGERMSAANGYVCMLMNNQTVRCWGGDNFDGELGNGNVGSSVSPPFTVVDLNDAASISLGYGDAHMCAIRENGTVGCWGENRNGQLGIGSVTGGPNPRPLTVHAL